jgi:hypothetical protein
VRACRSSARSEFIPRRTAARRAFVLDRNERRSITKGQKAMAHAMLFPVAIDKGGRGYKKTPAQNAGVFSDTLLKQARAVLAYSPELARRVRDAASRAGRRQWRGRCCSRLRDR